MIVIKIGLKLLKGNTFREINEDPEFFCEVTGIPLDLFKCYLCIRTALRCGRPLDPVKFKEKTAEFKRLFELYYPTLYMWPTLHKAICYFLYIPFLAEVISPL